MTVYLDASVLVTLFIEEPLSDRADKFLDQGGPVLVVSDFARAEFASATARLVRTGTLTAEDARRVFEAFDAWSAQLPERAETGTVDVTAAAGFLRRLDLTLRTPDALNIAIAARLGAELATFDQKMAIAAQALGVKVAAI